mmetsp:Transcript_35962/g.117486  ORF Transcript_35962/g.117486 Transcript_35962/m.117486 type:complete len:317 (-) Transcript_35962:530-1480(-)
MEVLLRRRLVRAPHSPACTKTPERAGGGGGGAASLVRDLSESDLSSLGAEPHVLAFGDVDGLEALAEATYGQVVVGRAPAALAAKYGGKEAPAVAMLPFGAAEKAAKKAVPFAADAAGLDAAKKGALASLPDSLVDKLGQGSPDMFFSAALTQTAAKAACLLFSDKAEVPPIFRSLSMAFEGQMQFGFAPPAMMAQFNIDRAPALLVLWNENEGKDEQDAQAGMKLTGARFMPQVHGKFSYGNIAAFVASVVEQRLQMLGALAGGTEAAGPPQRRSSRREACSCRRARRRGQAGRRRGRGREGEGGRRKQGRRPPA